MNILNYPESKSKISTTRSERKLDRYESEYSYISGENFEAEEITEAHLRQITYELGLINLAWPPIKYAEFEGRSTWPISYLENSNKERLLLVYTENMRRQFISLYPDRRILVLAAENECGLQVQSKIYLFFNTLLSRD